VTRVSRLLIAWLLICVAGGCGGPRAPVTVPGSVGATIPHGALDALRSRWDGVKLGAGDSGNCAEGPDPTPLVSGDLNGDGTTDIALWVTIGNTSRLAALFARVGGEYSVAEVVGPDESARGRVELLRRGTLVRTPPGRFDPYLGLDTISLRACDGSRVAWVWMGSGFRPEPLVD